ncbi:MAG TPA: hypothetical protein VFY81_13630 [Gammaproteobacteria bacterium]|nr:hypothetical protein [Gammaproteobacteria bacterium]
MRHRQLDLAVQAAVALSYIEAAAGCSRRLMKKRPPRLSGKSHQGNHEAIGGADAIMVRRLTPSYLGAGISDWGSAIQQIVFIGLFCSISRRLFA